MFEGLKSALGLTAPVEKTGVTEVDSVTHQMLRDLNLPDPDPADDAQPVVDRRDPLEEAREVVTDWENEGYDIEQPLRVVFEALFDSEPKAQSYLRAAQTLGLEGLESPATRKFGDSIAATFVVSMLAAPEEIVRIEQAIGPSAQQYGGKIDGYYLEGHADGD